MFYCLFLWRIPIIAKSKLYALILSNYFLRDTLTKQQLLFISFALVLFAQSFLTFIRDEFSLTIT